MAKKQKTNRAPFGSVRKLPSGRWQARYPDESGAPMNAPHTFSTSTEAWDHVAMVKADRRRGIYTDHRNGEALLADYAAEWIENGGSRGKLAIRVTELYKDLLARHIAPTLGANPIGKVTPAAVRKWYKELGEELAERAAAPRKNEKNTAPRVATGVTRQAQAYRLLKSIMNTALNDNLIGKNPCQIKGAGQVKAGERPLISLKNFNALVEAHPADLRPVLHAVFGAHLRLGEAVALKRGDFDTKTGMLKVSEQVVYSTEKGEVRTKTKTNNVRNVLLPTENAEAIRAYLKTAPTAFPNSPLFVRANGRQLTRAQLQHAWTKARNATGLEQFHFHDLKGSGLTLFARGGATTKEIMNRGGHTTATAALIYQHGAEEREAALVGTMDAAMEAAKQA